MSLIRLAMIDSGIGRDQPIALRRFHSLVESQDPYDRVGHGTAILRTIGWHVGLERLELDLVKLFDRRLTAGSRQLVQAMEWLAQAPPAWVICSVGLTDPDPALHTSIRRLHAAGTRIVASSARFGSSVYPAAWREVFAVTGDARRLPNAPGLGTDGRWLACAWAAQPDGLQPWQVGPPQQQHAGRQILGGASFAAAHALGRWLATQPPPDEG
ncbi:hypothetical protein [Billgrantia saliphila]|uniref:hypothetical protein n=1 Tax=Billgrantia saliphila TaxID=1848458 RepID=UPI000CE4D19F|nr:hypothetical protein [Halomonas saliphila]